jgi:hypothetical protein
MDIHHDNERTYPFPSGFETFPFFILGRKVLFRILYRFLFASRREVRPKFDLALLVCRGPLNCVHVSRLYEMQSTSASLFNLPRLGVIVVVTEIGIYANAS